jgi:hypothetical protein
MHIQKLHYSYTAALIIYQPNVVRAFANSVFPNAGSDNREEKGEGLDISSRVISEPLA